MKSVPITYPVRSVVVRWRSSLFSAVGIACTVGVLTGILSLSAGVAQLYGESGSEELAMYMRPGATSEGESAIRLEQVRILKNERPEIARADDGQPMAAAESFLALNLERVGGGTTNVPIRGIEEMSIRLQGDAFKLTDGDPMTFGADEIIVGEPVTRRIANCQLGDTLIVNVTPFRIVGVFEHKGAYGSEIWGDVDRITRALDLEFRQRVMAKLVPGTSIDAVSKELENDKRVPAKVMTEAAYLDSQKGALGATFSVLAFLISTIMGIAAVLGATTTMLASIGSRTREVGIFLSLGFPRVSIFLAFLLEALIIGTLGGILGALAVLPFNGIETGTTNFQTFTEVSFAFRVTPALLGQAIVVAILLGLLGGLVPAYRACRMLPTTALGRH